MKQRGSIASISISCGKGTPKSAVCTAILRIDHGLVDDAHAGSGHRQVSILAAESIRRAAALAPGLSFGSFAENLATEDIDWRLAEIGDQVHIGRSVVLEITQIGKECHGQGCAVYRLAGDCIMPREGVFARVLKGGSIALGDPVLLRNGRS